MVYRYSFLRQISNDNYSFISLMGIILFSYFFIHFTDDIALMVVFAIGSFVSFISLVFMIMRGKYFTTNGLEIEAVITGLSNFRGILYIYYNYSIEEKYFVGRDGVRMITRNDEYKMDDKIKIFVDPKNHEKSVMVNAISVRLAK